MIPLYVRGWAAFAPHEAAGTPGWLGWCGSIMVIHDRIIARFVSLLLSPGFWNVPTTSGTQTQFFHTIHRRRRRCRFSRRTYNKCIISPCLARLLRVPDEYVFDHSGPNKTYQRLNSSSDQIKTELPRIISALFVLCSNMLCVSLG